MRVGESMDFFLLSAILGELGYRGMSSSAVMVMLEAIGFFSMSSLILSGCWLVWLLRMSESCLRVVDCLLLCRQFSFSIILWYLRIMSYLSMS